MSNHTTILQICINNKATNYKYNMDECKTLIKKMIELQEEYPTKSITFLTIEI